GLSIRTLREQRMGFSYTFDLSRDAVETAVRRALEVGELMPADPLNDLGDVAGGKGFSGATYSKINAYDHGGLEVPLEQKIELTCQLEAQAKKLDSRIKRVRKAELDSIEGETILVDSKGTQLRYASTLYSAALVCVAEQGSDAETGYDARYSNVYSK